MLPQSIRPSTGQDLGFDIRISGFFRGWVFRCFVMFSENKRICDASALIRQMPSISGRPQQRNSELGQPGASISGERQQGEAQQANHHSSPDTRSIVYGGKPAKGT